MHCKAGDVLKGFAVSEKKKSLRSIVVEHGWPLLWECEECGEAWESSFEGRYDEREQLMCLDREAVKKRWGSKLVPRK